MEEGFEGCVNGGHAIYAVDIAVFPIAVVDVVLWHCSFWTIED